MTTIDAISVSATSRLGLSRLERRYWLALLSMAAIDLFLSAVFLQLSGKLWIIALRLPEIFIFLVVLTLAGGYRLFGPIRHFLRTGEGAEEARERAARLGPMTTLWVTAVSILFTIWSFFIAPFLIFDVEMTREIMFILVGRALAWIVLLPFVAIFAVQEYLRHLRRVLFDRYGMVVPPGRAMLGRKVALILLGGAIVPGVSIAITLTLVPEISPITGQPRSVVIATTLIGTAVALALAFWATERSTTAAFRTLLGGMRRAQAGDLGNPVPVETDDELWRLGVGFNELTRALADARIETEHKEAERALAANQFQEAQKRDALGRLAAGIAHDFNNILAIIVMNSTMAQKRCADDEIAQKRMAEVLAAAGRGRDLISHILDFARDKPVDHEPFDIVENVRETVALIHDTLARDVELELDLPEKALAVTGDATGLHQILANLMINAVHAMPGGDARLSISLDTITADGGRSDGLRKKVGVETSLIVYEEDGNGMAHALFGILDAGVHARLSIKDNGTGMSAETLRNVFNPYFTTKAVGEGTGLGLAAVTGIVEAHGGGLHVRTRSGEGTRFEIFIPCDRKETRDGSHLVDG